ncbi:hypothetical protein LJC23_01145 [Desulfovibrio sp. OttesenSCG-928-I05]|nr:hypothetical protein [Desulfovibrio sp. OttesenSCG-928-I05]
MGKVLFTLILEERPIRKKSVPPTKAHKNKRAYSRKAKHAARGKDDTIPENSGIFFVVKPEGSLLSDIRVVRPGIVSARCP